jgi:hypothetical protein
MRRVCRALRKHTTLSDGAGSRRLRHLQTSLDGAVARSVTSFEHEESCRGLRLPNIVMLSGGDRSPRT